MSTSSSYPQARRVLIVGLGGLGCPAVLGLVGERGLSLVLCDDDRVESSNLHRQVLYRDEDVGRDKLEAAQEALKARGVSAERIELVRSRLLPDNARQLVRSVDLVLEGADNYATKFLAADAAYLEHRPIIHGAAIRWTATAWAVGPQGAPCYRCLFEDLPAEETTCVEAGVMGPVVGVAGALMADLALDFCSGNTPRLGVVHTYDGKMDRLRRVTVSRRASCALCGDSAEIREVRAARYLPRAWCRKETPWK